MDLNLATWHGHSRALGKLWVVVGGLTLGWMLGPSEGVICDDIFNFLNSDITVGRVRHLPGN